MGAYLNTVLLARREGVITLVASVIYLVLGLIAKYAPAVSPLPPFYGMLSPFAAFALVLVYFQLGGFRKKFESGIFNTGILVCTALVPVLVAIKSAAGL